MGLLDGLLSGIQRVFQGGTLKGTRGGINFIGATVTDDPDNDRLDIEITGTGTPTTRVITAGAGLTGGGNLSTDRTINVGAADSTIVVEADGIRLSPALSTTDQSISDSATLTLIATGQLDLASTGGDTWLRSETGQVFVGGMTIDQYSDDWWNAESGTSLWFTAGTDMAFDAGTTMSFASAGAMTFDNSGGTSDIVFGTSGEFYVAAANLSISNTDSAGSALFYSQGEMDIEARSNLLIRSRVLGSADTLASSLSILGANATSGATGSTNRRGGAVILNAGRGRTPGTDAAGPIYIGLGEEDASTQVTNGMVFGHGAAVGTVGSADYVPFTSEVGRIRTTSGQLYFTGSFAQFDFLQNATFRGQNGCYLYGGAAGMTISASGTASMTSTGGSAYIMAASASTCSMNGGTNEFRAALRVANFQNYNASETRLTISYPAEVAIASTASTYTTLVTLPMSGATGTAPTTLTGIVHVYEAAGATQVFEFKVTFRPDGSTGTMVGTPTITSEGSTLGTLEIDSTGGCRLRFLSDAASANTKTARVTNVEFK